jgi:hypothetical protein
LPKPLGEEGALKALGACGSWRGESPPKALMVYNICMDLGRKICKSSRQPME